MANGWPSLMTAQEVATVARVHVYTFQKWCRDGQGPAQTKIGGIVRYADADVRTWIEQRRQSA